MFKEFVRESNRIEGIIRDPTDEEVSAHYNFVDLIKPTVADMANLVRVLQPDARLRDNMSVPGVQVGGHIAPPSGPEIREQLSYILDIAYDAYSIQIAKGTRPDSKLIWGLHCDYECLHPFTDGNGRSGRALWLWCMGGHAPLGFLHQFYYQTLSAYR